MHVPAGVPKIRLEFRRWGDDSSEGVDEAAQVPGGVGGVSVVRVSVLHLAGVAGVTHVVSIVTAGYMGGYTVICTVRECVCVCVHACVCVCVCVRVRACVRACVCVWVHKLITVQTAALCILCTLCIRT